MDCDISIIQQFHAERPNGYLRIASLVSPRTYPILKITPRPCKPSSLQRVCIWTDTIHQITKGTPGSLSRRKVTGCYADYCKVGPESHSHFHSIVPTRLPLAWPDIFPNFPLPSLSISVLHKQASDTHPIRRHCALVAHGKAWRILGAH